MNRKKEKDEQSITARKRSNTHRCSICMEFGHNKRRCQGGPIDEAQGRKKENGKSNNLKSGSNKRDRKKKMKVYPLLYGGLMLVLYLSTQFFLFLCVRNKKTHVIGSSTQPCARQLTPRNVDMGVRHNLSLGIGNILSFLGRFFNLDQCITLINILDIP